jgi:hypothetical protein
MSSEKTIPIIFGVTGHRDLVEDDKTKIEDAISKLLHKYIQKFPNTDKILLSALAEGADILVADIAIKLGISLHVILPYEEEEYLKTFTDTTEIERFKRLLSQASKVKIINSNEKKDSTLNNYQFAGYKIADESDILIALWDGNFNGKLGGTSDIVKYKLDTFCHDNRRVLEGTALYTIKVKRVSNKDVQTTLNIEKIFVGNLSNEAILENAFQKIDETNKKIKNMTILQRTYSCLDDFRNAFGTIANFSQRRFKIYMKTILILSAIAFIFLEGMHDFHWELGIPFYGFSLLFAFGIYYFLMDRGTLQDTFVYSRSISEALRIQSVWNHSKINENVVRYYPHERHARYLWVKILLKNICYITNTSDCHIKKSTKPEAWIDEQVDYYKNALKIRNKRFKFWKELEHFFYIFGLIALILMFIVYFIEYFMHTESLPKIVLHILIFSSGIPFMIAAFIGEKYVKIESFEEEIANFELMLNYFLDAKKALEDIDSKEDRLYKKIIKELGVKALEENSQWLIIHSKETVKPVVE